jgi:putative membrane protein
MAGEAGDVGDLSDLGDPKETTREAAGAGDGRQGSHAHEEEHAHSHVIEETAHVPISALVIRSGIGGVLMGLANLVPGISGGTMLLAAGVYPSFISAIAEVTTFKFRLRSLVTLGVIAGCAGLGILLLAGVMKSLVIEQRWLMYSIFIGLTLGGVPLVWRLAVPATPSLWAGAVVSFGLMVVMAFSGGGQGAEAGGPLLLVLSGLGGASAMILPGVSGGYLLLLLGQYEPILGAIDDVKTGLIGAAGFQMPMVMEAMTVLVPVGIGVVIGIVGVSNLLRFLLDRFEKPTLGILLGLLLGSVVGLYPFQKPVQPEAGFLHRGLVLDARGAAELKEKYWPLERYTPGAGQLGASAGLLLAGLGATLLIARVGGVGRDAEEDTP